MAGSGPKPSAIVLPPQLGCPHKPCQGSAFRYFCLLFRATPGLEPWREMKLTVESLTDTALALQEKPP